VSVDVTHDVSPLTELKATARPAGRIGPIVMGIVNVTPDSFYDGGRHFDTDAAVAHGLSLAGQGADVLDVGGQSTRPGAEPVPPAEQQRRVVPVIEALQSNTDCVISVDTPDATVAEAALNAGATVLNDVTGLRGDPRMAEVAANSGAPVVCMHMQGTPRTMQKDPAYADVVDDIGAFFEERMAWMAARGVSPQRVVLDPGIGFGKTVEHNLDILRRIEEFHALGRPLCVGHSNKAFIGHVLGGVETGERGNGTLAVTAWLWQAGVQVLRVHDVEAACQAIRMLEAVRGGL